MCSLGINLTIDFFALTVKAFVGLITWVVAMSNRSLLYVIALRPLVVLYYCVYCRLPYKGEYMMAKPRVDGLQNHWSSICS